MPTIYGSIERIVYHDQSNDYVVARFLEEGKNEDILTIVGHMSGVSAGVPLRVNGEWSNNKKYGPQLNIQSYETTPPKTPEGVKKYLGSGLIKGIGPVMADRIVETLGIAALDIIEKNPEKLSDVEGISKKRIQMLTGALEAQKDIGEIMSFLQSYLPGMANATKIYKHYGKDSIEIVRQNPYRLAAEVHGIGFKTADQIAMSLGFSKDSPMRIKEGTFHILYQYTDFGHVYCTHDMLCQDAARLLDVACDRIADAVQALQDDGRVVIEPNGEENRVYLTAHYQAEVNLAKNLVVLRDSPSRLRSIDTAKAVDWAEGKLNITFADKQKEAISRAIQDKILVITGGPGTGKTTIIRAILKILEKTTTKIALAAPTGRAAKRMEEVIGRPAQTIHRLLEFNPQKGGFKRNRHNPLDASVVVIDESSMIDLFLMHNLVKAIPSHAVLILVGDVDQLPPVGPGNVLKDIINSAEFSVITLNEIFRQSLQSRIVTNAHKINSGEFPDIKNESKKSDFYFLKEEDHEKIPEIIADLCRRRLPEKFNLDPFKDIQVLSPMHKGPAGVENLNNLLQKELNPSGLFIIRGRKTLRVGDKVMQIRNNYNMMVFNGDIGQISFIDETDQVVKVKYDDRIVDYDYADLDEIVLAYAASVHKAQGSEYPAVIIPIVTQHYILLQRNLLYTAVTRGKKLVVLVGIPKAVGIAVNNNKPQARHTKLKDRLSSYSEKAVDF